MRCLCIVRAGAIFSPDTGRHLNDTSSVDSVRRRVVEMYPSYGFYLCVILMCVVTSVVGAPPDKNYETVSETKWGARSAMSLFLCFV